MRNILTCFLLSLLASGCISPEFQLYKKEYERYKAGKEKYPDKPACISQSIEPTPERIIDQSKTHIINLVGEDYFKENYVFSESKSYGFFQSDCSINYSAIYEYLPMSQFFGKQKYVFVHFSWPVIEPSPYSLGVALTENGKGSLPKITKTMANRILGKHLSVSHSSNKYYSYGRQNCKTDTTWCWSFKVIDDYPGCQDESIDYQVDVLSGNVYEHTFYGMCE